MKYFNVIIVAVALMLASCGGQKNKSQLVVISTPYGDMTVKLYDKTEKHNANFRKLVSDGFYDSLMFHRVIDGFMIQGGDPNSRTALPGAALGEGDPGYTIDAEIMFPTYFHKKGALAAARTGDKVNPEKKSSGSQFYIVQGKPLTDEELDAAEDRVNNGLKQQLFYQLLERFNDSLNIYQKQGDSQRLMALNSRLFELVEDRYAAMEHFSIPDSIRQVYKTIGGTPFLDNNYTVFGEVVEGLDIIDSIASVATDNRDRPLQDVRMAIKLKK